MLVVHNQLLLCQDFQWMCTPVINSIYSQYTYFLSVLNLECTGKSTFTSWVSWKVENGLQKQWFVHQHLKDKMSFDKYYWKRNIQCKLNFHITWTAAGNNPLPSHHHSVGGSLQIFWILHQIFLSIYKGSWGISSILTIGKINSFNL